MDTEIKQQVTPRDVAYRLKLVIDPEVGLNIVDLGLVYNITCRDTSVNVAVTMTFRGCPMTRYIQTSMENVLSKMPGVEEYDVELVWVPSWSPAMIDPSVPLRRPRYST